MSEKLYDPTMYVGEIYGIYKIIEMLEERDKYGFQLYKGECQECGRKKIGTLSAFKSPSKMATQCNHIGIDGLEKQNTIWSNKRIGGIFRGMKRRCYANTDKDYIHYGGKGIKICDEWMNDNLLFEVWSMENGYADNLTIDRVDCDGNYCPENCRWVTLENNSKYKSTTSEITVNGEMHTGKDWSRILGLGENQINKYIRKYGLDNTIEFIKRRMKNTDLTPRKRHSYYDLYMNQT